MTQSPLVEIHTVELLASRICHDLISPVSAMNNGLEFLGDAGPAAMKEAMELLTYSAAMASAKLQILRMVYGAGGADPTIRIDDIRQMFDALLSLEGKIKVSWDEASLPPPADQGEGYAKILAATVLMAIESLPRGGSVQVRGDQGTALVTAQGTGAALRRGVEQALQARFPAPALDPKTVHPYMVGLLSTHYGFPVRLETAETDRVVLRVGSAA